MQTDDGCDTFWLAYGDYNGRRAVKPFVRYLVARFKRELKQEVWKRYVADCLNLIPQQKYMTISYTEIMEQIDGRQEKQTAEEIIEDIMTRHNLTFK